MIIQILSDKITNSPLKPLIIELILVQFSYIIAILSWIISMIGYFNNSSLTYEVAFVFFFAGYFLLSGFLVILGLCTIISIVKFFKLRKVTNSFLIRILWFLIMTALLSAFYLFIVRNFLSSIFNFNNLFSESGLFSLISISIFVYYLLIFFTLIICFSFVFIASDRITKMLIRNSIVIVILIIFTILWPIWIKM